MNQERTLIVRLRALGYAANLTRFNLFILLAGFVLLYVDQGQDLLLTIAEDNAWFSLLGGGLLWAWSIWYWARLLLDIRFPDPPIHQDDLAWWRTHLPRILGAAAFAAVAWNLYRASGFTVHVLAVLILGILFYFGVFYRRPISRRLASRLQKDDPRASLFWVDEIDNRRDLVNARWMDDILAVWGKIPVKLTVVLGLGMFAWGMISPLTMGFTFNTLVLLFFWGATFLPTGSLITYIGSRNGYPLFTILFVLAMVFSHFNDNHTIRRLGEIPAPPRPDLDTAFEQWAQQHQCNATSCPPLVIMATAGGGIRAAYWTGTVLGNLDDELAKRQKTLRDNLFAISGVSGGSVGSTVYRAALEAEVPPGQRMTTVQQVLARDFLAPLAAGLLYPDFLQRFMPAALFADRAVTFEEGLESGFEKVIGQDTLKQSFSNLTAETAAPWPALFLNSTWSENGRRIVAAAYEMPASQRLYADLISSLGHDLRLSTAAHNSARFPYASPPGSWTLTLAPGGQQPGQEPPHLLQRLQDGGLFENYGAETAMELLRAAEVYFANHGYYFDPMVILISSDPSLPKNLAEPQIKQPIEFGYEVFTTVRTYTATRVGRGAEAASRLKAELIRLQKNQRPGLEEQQRFANFRMCTEGEQENPPLGWALSRRAQESIKGYLLDLPDQAQPPCRKDNQAALSKVLDALARE